MVYDYLEISNRCNTGQKLEKERWDIDQIVLPTRQLVRTTNPKKTHCHHPGSRLVARPGCLCWTIDSQLS
jgi:hypothetical protein